MTAVPQRFSPPEIVVHGEVILHRLFDVGYEIDLDQAAALLAARIPERAGPARGEAQAIRIANPPVTVPLGTRRRVLAGHEIEIDVSARAYDFGVVSVRERIVAPPSLGFEEFAVFGSAACDGTWPQLAAELEGLLGVIRPAIERPLLAEITEDYVVFRIHRLEDRAGQPIPVEVLGDVRVTRLLFDETRALSPDARRDLLSRRFSYFEDDLAVLTWNSALVVEPVVEDTDVQYVLEFANAQLLELRYHDAQLDAELPRIYDSIAAARGTFHLLGRRYGRLLRVLQRRVTDATEAVERAENALKVTDDVFLSRIYAAALEIFRGQAWRSDIDRKVAILRDTYSMLNDESQARRTEVLEAVIIALFVLDIGLSLWPK